MVLGMRDFTHHITTVRDTYERVKAKGYHVIYREFEELGERSYHPTSNDDAIGWATRLRNKNIAPRPRIEPAHSLREGYAAGAHCRLLSILGAGWWSSGGRGAGKTLRFARRWRPRSRSRDVQPRYFW